MHMQGSVRRTIQATITVNVTDKYSTMAISIRVTTMLTSSIDFSAFYQWLKNSDMSHWHDKLPTLINERLDDRRWGDMPDWKAALEELPDLNARELELEHSVKVIGNGSLDPAQLSQLRKGLKGLHPWRKGPYDIFGVDINTEWRSDWKWDRVLPHLQSLQNRLILDIGCGNGYHCWRMLGAGAKRVIGIDPSVKFVFQFAAIKKLTGQSPPIDVLPLGIEHLPKNLAAFDTVFSMGILYHRRSPMDHLRELRSLLRPGGQLVLETLVVDGPEGQVLVPEGRYAKMPNVWFLPSPPTLLSWLRKIGFVEPRLVDLNTTSIQEQRSTEWMTFDSLADFLDPNDSSMTIEGHPRPQRAILLAEAPF